MGRAALATLILLAAFRNEGGPSVGWRGDGTGKYPNTQPPGRWGRISTAVRGLRFQAGKPNASDAGAPMPDGLIRDWLVLSPAPEGTKVEKETFPNESELAPEENEACGNATWKKASFETAWLDFSKVLGKPEKTIACAATNIYSDTGGKFRLNATQLAGFRILLNGKPLPTAYGRYAIDLNKGWNRLLLKVAPRDADWACTVALQARSPAAFENTNIAWMTPLPGVTGGFYGGGMGVGSPILVKDRFYLLSEPHDLVCLNKADGKILWIRTNSYFDAATAEDRKKPAYAEAEAIARKLNDLNGSLSNLEEKVKAENELYARMREVDPARYKKSETPDVGFSGFSPISDGTSIYLWLATGITACYDLEGNRRWIRVDNLPGIEHGFSSSPILVDGKIIVFMRDVLAIDARTGTLAWQIPLVSHEGANPEGYFHGTPAAVTIGGVPLVVLGNGTIVRASDGKILFTHPPMGKQAISSPVVEKDLLLQVSGWGMKLFIHQLPDRVTEPLKITTRELSIDTPGFPRYYLPWTMASPVVHEGLAYLMNNAGVLTVVDLREARILYQRLIDIDHFQTNNEGAARGCGISPALAGKHLYFFGNSGSAVVLEPGRIFKPIAKNKLESLVSVGHWGERQERFVCNPVFDGTRLYLRGEGHLYALDAHAAPSTTSAGESSRGPRPAATGTGSASRGPSPSPAPKGLEPEPASPVHGWRRNSTGTYPGVSPPTEWSEKKNVKWTATVGSGSSSPVVSGGRVLLLAEPGMLWCLALADGKPFWKSDLTKDLPGEVREKLRDPKVTKERARATPVTDGKRIYTVLMNGLVSCTSIDGTRQWVQVVEPAALQYGPSASPVLVGNVLLVDSTRLVALDAATGRVLWTAKEGEPHYGSPAVIPLDGIPCAVTSKGALIRVSDGTVLATDLATGLGGDQAPTPLVQEGVVYFAYRHCSAVRLSLKEGKVSAAKLWEQDLPGEVIASPVLKDGMLFVMPVTPTYRVLDQKTGAVLLAKDLDLGVNFYPSLALAGKYLFLGNDKGDTLVLEPSATYKEVGRNDLPEGSGASPAFAGSNLLLRGGESLYCIGP